MKAKQEVSDRLEKLVKAGTDPVKDLAAAKADYIQATIQSQKDEHEAQTNVNNAKRTLATLERQLFQAGIDPELLAKADQRAWPLSPPKSPRAASGWWKRARPASRQFSAFPGMIVPAAFAASRRRSPRSVARSASSSSSTIPMAAETGHVRRNQLGHRRPQDAPDLGRRRAARRPIRLCARRDQGTRYPGRGDWQITKIETGEQYGSQIEVLKGLQSGDRVIGYGAILLKPYVVEDVSTIADDRRPDPSGVESTLARADVGRRACRPGVWAFQRQQIDAYPDISGQMVQIITTYPGRAPEEVERQVTIPLEIVMRSVPRVEKIRSRTIFGLSIVEVMFEEGVENYWARHASRRSSTRPRCPTA